MATTYYFKDSYPPTRYSAMTGTLPTWEVLLTDGKATPTDLILYSLYDNSTLFNLWKEWAALNKYAGSENDKNYDGLVFAVKGYWPVIVVEDPKVTDVMCFISETAEHGAVCIATDDKDAFTTKTFNFTKTQWTAFISSPTHDLSAAADVQTVDPANGIFEGFQKFHCENYQDFVFIECRAWQRVRKAGDGFEKYPRFAPGDKIKTLWIDGSVGSGNAGYFYPTDYAGSEAKTLKQSGASSLAAAALPLAIAYTMLF